MELVPEPIRQFMMPETLDMAGSHFSIEFNAPNCAPVYAFGYFSSGMYIGIPVELIIETERHAVIQSYDVMIPNIPWPEFVDPRDAFHFAREVWKNEHGRALPEGSNDDQTHRNTVSDHAGLVERGSQASG